MITLCLSGVMVVVILVLCPLDTSSNYRGCGRYWGGERSRRVEGTYYNDVYLEVAGYVFVGQYRELMILESEMAFRSSYQLSHELRGTSRWGTFSPLSGGWRWNKLSDCRFLGRGNLDANDTSVYGCAAFLCWHCRMSERKWSKIVVLDWKLSTQSFQSCRSELWFTRTSPCSA